MAMGGEEAPAEFPEPGPKALAIGLRQRERRQFLPREELKPAFAMDRRKHGQPGPQLEEKHEPMALAQVAVLADQAGEVKIRRTGADAEFLRGFTARTGVRRFTGGGVQLAAAGAPQAAVGLLRALHQEHAVLRIEAVKQRGNFVRQWR